MVNKQERINFYSDSEGHLRMMLNFYLEAGYEIRQTLDNRKSSLATENKIDHHIVMILKN